MGYLKIKDEMHKTIKFVYKRIENNNILVIPIIKNKLRKYLRQLPK